MAKQEHIYFEDTIEVYTSQYGTQYVLSIDLLLTRAEMLKILDEVRADYLKG